jgi:hypothetical protein
MDHCGTERFVLTGYFPRSLDINLDLGPGLINLRCGLMNLSVPF